jgi:putative redox protein
MVKITAAYGGELRCRAIHGPSGSELLTDAPTDNHGKGQSFSPTDLVAAALATCTMTVMAIVAEREGVDLRGMRAEVDKGMVNQPRRRIAALPIEITLPASLAPEQRRKLEAAARACPVHASLHPDVDAPIRFVYAPL